MPAHDVVQVERASWQIVEVVLGGEGHCPVVVGSQVFDALGTGIRVVLARHMIGHEIHNEAQSGLVGAADEVLQFLHASRHIGGQIGIHIIVVLYCIRAAGLSLDHILAVGLDAVGRIVGLGGVLDESGEPHMCGSQTSYLIERLAAESSQGAASVLLLSACGDAFCAVVAEESGQYLIDGHAPIPLTVTESFPLAILAIMPCRAFPGPHSVNSVAPASIMLFTS